MRSSALLLLLIVVCVGCAPQSGIHRDPAPAAAIDLRQLIDNGSSAQLRSALADERSSYAVRLEALRQIRRARPGDAAALLRQRVERSRDALEQAAALDVFFDLYPDQARAAAGELAERCVDAAGEAALAKAIVVHRCASAYPLAARLLARGGDDRLLFHLRAWVRADGAAMAVALRAEIPEGPSPLAALMRVLASEIDGAGEAPSVLEALTAAGFPPRALRAHAEHVGAGALPTVRAALPMAGPARCGAIDLIGELGDAESIAAVQAILGDTADVDERAACLRALGRLRCEAILPQLQAALRDRTARPVLGGESYPIAEAAAQGLAAIADPQAFAALTGALAEAVQTSLVSSLAAALLERGDRAAIRPLEGARVRLWNAAPRAADACTVASDSLQDPPAERILAYVIAYRCGDRQLTVLTDTPLQPASGAGEQLFGIDAPDAVAQESFLLPVEDIPRAIQARNSRRLDRLHYLGCAIDAVDLLAR